MSPKRPTNPNFASMRHVVIQVPPTSNLFTPGDEVMLIDQPVEVTAPIKRDISSSIRRQIQGPANQMEEDFVGLIGRGDHAHSLSEKLVNQDPTRFADLTILGIRRWSKSKEG